MSWSLTKLRSAWLIWWWLRPLRSLSLMKLGKFLFTQSSEVEQEFFRFRLAKRQYIALYILNTIVIAGLLLLLLRTASSAVWFSLLTVILLSLLTQIIFKPYFNILDNLGIIFNSICMATFMIVFELRNQQIISPSSYNDKSIAIGVVVCCGLAILLSVVRIVRVQCYQHNSQ